jgi:hypothetical protein
MEAKEGAAPRVAPLARRRLGEKAQATPGARDLRAAAHDDSHRSPSSDARPIEHQPRFDARDLQLAFLVPRERTRERVVGSEESLERRKDVGT